MKVTKQFIDQIIKRLYNSNANSNMTVLQLAQDLYWARHVVNWRLTDYRTWEKFCIAELPMSYSVARSHVRTTTLIKKYKYTDKNCKDILHAVSWSSFALGLSDMNKKLGVKAFIKAYKDIRKASVKVDPTSGGDRLYTFSLPAETADILDTYLLNYGMTIHNAKRVGVRDALITLINQKLK